MSVVGASVAISEKDGRRDKIRKLDLVSLQDYIKANSKATLKEIGLHFGCSASTVCRGLSKLGIRHRNKQKLDFDSLNAFLAENPNATQKEIGQAFDCTENTVRRAYIRYGMPPKQRARWGQNRCVPRR